MKKAVALVLFSFWAQNLSAQDSALFKRDTLKYSTPTYYFKKDENTKSKSHLNLVPGVNLFLYTSRGTAIDINPYVTKQLSSHWSLGIGWNQRLSLNRIRYRGNYTAQLYGPRIMITYRWIHGFSFRLIPETMHIRLPRNIYPTNPYQWDWSVFGGVRKNFKIGKNTTGYLELLYNMASTSILPLYGDKINLRVGFEFRKLFRKKS